MFLRKRCRCCTECTIASDNFNRADSSTVDGWTEIAGDWSIADNGLKPPTSGLDDIIRFDTPDPEDPADDGIRWTISFDMGSSLSGEVRAIVDYVDANNFHFAEVVPGAANQLILRLYKRESGTNSELAEVVIDGVTQLGPHTLSVCWGFQSVIPTCSGCSMTWQWTYDPVVDGYSWNPIEITGDTENCADAICLFPYPDFDGTVANETTSTDGYSPEGTEGASIFGIGARLDDQHTAFSITTPLDGDCVGLAVNNADATFRFDNAALTRLKDRCPDCSGGDSPCMFCEGGVEPSNWLVEISGVVADDDCPSCFEYNGTYALSLAPGAMGSVMNTLCVGGVNQHYLTTHCNLYVTSKFATLCWEDPSLVPLATPPGFFVALLIGYPVDRDAAPDPTRNILLDVRIMPMTGGGTGTYFPFATFRLETAFPANGSLGLPDCFTEFDNVSVPLFCTRDDYTLCDFSGATVTVSVA